MGVGGAQREEILAAAEKGRRLSFIDRERPPQAGRCRVKGIFLSKGTM